MSNRSKEISTALLGLLGEALLYYSIDHFVTAIIPLFYSLLTGKLLSQIQYITAFGTIVASLAIAITTFSFLRRFRKKTLVERIKQELEECATKYFKTWQGLIGLLTNQKHTPSVIWPPYNYQMARLAQEQYYILSSLNLAWWDYKLDSKGDLRMKEGMSEDVALAQIDHAKMDAVIFKFGNLVGKMKILGDGIFKEFPMPKPNGHWWEKREFQSLERKYAVKKIEENYSSRIAPLVQKGESLKRDFEDALGDLRAL